MPKMTDGRRRWLEQQMFELMWRLARNTRYGRCLMRELEKKGGRHFVSKVSSEPIPKLLADGNQSFLGLEQVSLREYVPEFTAEDKELLHQFMSVEIL